MRPVHVFVSARHAPEGVVCPDYDDPSYLQDLSQALGAIGAAWEWVPVTLQDLSERVSRAKSAGAVVLNLCDADASQGMPGVETIRELDARGVPYTGADRFFYELTTSRRGMKSRFRAAGVPQSDWTFLATPDQDLSGIPLPAIVKPDVSGGSYGIEKSSVVEDGAQLRAQVARLFSGDLHGRDFRRDGVVAEALQARQAV